MIPNYLDILANTIREKWDQPALTDLCFTADSTALDLERGNRYTYGEMYSAVVDTANMLYDMGLRKGDHIAICGENSSNWIIAYLAVSKLQAVAVVVMPMLPATQIAQLIDFADAKVLFADANTRTKIQNQSMPQLKSIVGVETLRFTRFASEVGFGDTNPEDPAMICFTSGSTEHPKAVLLANRTISANFAFVERTIPNYKGEQALIFLPLAHVMGQLLLSPLCYGCHTYVLCGFITTESLMAAVAHAKPYLVVIVPLLAEKLFERSDSNPLKSVPYFILGGANVSDEQIKYLIDNGIRLSAGYGLSETGGMVSLSAPDKFRIGSCGYMSDSTKVCIADNGEILVKGDNTMLGYYKDPEATARKIDADDWLHTGDKGHLDEDGYLYIEGRLEQDIIVLPNGENIHPEDIESKINAIPEVKESIVFAREGKLVAIAVCDKEEIDRRTILRTINPQLPLYSQIYDVELTETPLVRTEKQTLKRYLYK